MNPPFVPKYPLGTTPSPTIERWAFAESDMKSAARIRRCHRDDTFVSMETGVVTDRRGKATNQYTDGSFGVSREDAEAAEADENLYRYGDDGEYEPVVEWQDVAVMVDGTIACLAQQLVHCGCCEQFHRPQYHGDCRDDSERWATRHGEDGE